MATNSIIATVVCTLITYWLEFKTPAGKIFHEHNWVVIPYFVIMLVVWFAILIIPIIWTECISERWQRRRLRTIVFVMVLLAVCLSIFVPNQAYAKAEKQNETLVQWYDGAPIVINPVDGSPSFTLYIKKQSQTKLGDERIMTSYTLKIFKSWEANKGHQLLESLFCISSDSDPDDVTGLSSREHVVGRVHFQVSGKYFHTWRE